MLLGMLGTSVPPAPPSTATVWIRCEGRPAKRMCLSFSFCRTVSARALSEVGFGSVPWSPRVRFGVVFWSGTMS